VQPILPFVAFILAAFSALRLAKFNLDERQTTSFIGLPTPANALFWSSLLVAHSTTIETFSFARQLIIALLFITSYLLICELPMFALKFKTYALAENKLKYGFVAFSIIVFALTGIINGFWIVIACYVALSAIVALIERHKA
jgi:CDP-diacylglycerol--serine O-phosphatidyltransferase